MFFNNNDSLDRYLRINNIKSPKYSIGDIVYFHKIPLRTYIMDTEELEDLNKHSGLKFKVVEKLYLSFRKKWLSLIILVDEKFLLNKPTNFSFDAYVDDDDIFKIIGYEPKKRNKRVLENNIWYPYRFKTEEEMIKDYGENWREESTNMIVSWDDDVAEYSQMDKMLGTVFPYTEEELNLPYYEDKRAILRRYQFGNDDWSIGWWMLTNNEKINKKPTYIPKSIRRIIENNSNSYDIFVFVSNNDIESKEIQLNLYKHGFSWGIDIRDEDGVRYFNNDKVYLFAETFNMEIQYLFEKDVRSLKGNINSYIEQCISEGEKILPRIFNHNDSKYIECIIKHGRPSPIYTPKKTNKRLLEKKENILYIFDFDDTLFYSDSFQDNIKHLINEKIRPIDILNKSLSDIGASIKDLKYDNGRVYIDVIDNNIIIPINSDWVRKKERLYLKQPDLYYLTDEGLPNNPNNKIIELYKSVENKSIVTARKEKLLHTVEKTLDKYGLEQPNYGIFMYPNRTNKLPYVWKSDKILELYNTGNFDKIYYYDDNIKLLKKIKKRLLNTNIDITYYKVMKDKYRSINND